MGNLTLPDDVLTALCSLADSEESPQWDTAELLADLATEYGAKWPALIKQAADARHVTVKEAREWQTTFERCGTYRQQFEALNFSQFKYAARSADPLSLLTRAVETAEQWGGKPAPVSVMRAWLKAEKQKHAPTDAEIAAAALGRAHDNLNTARDRVKGGKVLQEIQLAQAHIMAALGMVRTQ